MPRCELIEGDFFQSVPPGGDVYVLKRVLVDYTDEKALQIFRNCLAAMKPDNRLLIIEPLGGAINEPSLARLMDLTYLLAGTGRVRSQEEHSSLLQRPACDCKSAFQLSRTFRFWKLYLRRYFPLFAQSRHATRDNECPLSGVKWTCPLHCKCPLMTQSGPGPAMRRQAR